MATGSFWTAVARLGGLPLGILSTIFLARYLGPEDLGIFAVSSSIVWLLLQLIGSLFNRTELKFIAEAADWQPVATGLIQVHFLVGVGVALLLVLLAPWLAALLGTPALGPALQLFACAIPIFSLRQAHINAVIGRGAFRRSALFSVLSDGYFVLVLLFVGLGWGVRGAILAQIIAFIPELLYARYLAPVPLFRRVPLQFRRMISYGGALFLDSAARQLNGRLDLWVVQAFVGSASAGYYSAAQSAMRPFQLLLNSLLPMLLATLAHAWERKELDQVRSVSQHTLRMLFCLLPAIALFAGAAPELIVLVFGRNFLPAAPLLTWLSFAAFANFVLSFTTTIMAAVDRPGTVATLTLPMVIVSTAGSLLLVPRIGAIGAAITSTLTLWIALGVTLWLLKHLLDIRLEGTVLLRILLVALFAYGLAERLAVSGWQLCVQLMGMGCLIAALLFLVRVLTREDLNFVVSLFHQERQELEQRLLLWRAREKANHV